MTEFPLFPGSMRACINCNVSELCLTSGLSSREVELLNALIVQCIKVRNNNPLYRIGDPFGSLYGVRVGSFKTSQLTVDGRERVTGFPIAGDILGLDAICSNTHSCNAFALEDSEVCLMPFARLEALAQKVPQLQRNISKFLSREIIHDQNMLFVMGNMNSDERIATFFLNLSQKFKARGYSSNEFVLKMQREEIGSYVGLRLETVCRSIGNLRNQALLEISGRNVKIVDMERLQRFVAGCYRNG